MRPRIRTIKPDFFGSPDLNTVGVGSRYVALGLISMADDRGRILLMLPAVRSYIFPRGDVSEKQCDKALAELTAIRFVWRYEVAPWTYLWLPKFWKHQKINRPSESSYPPDPNDPYGHLPVLEALAQFKADSENGHDPFTDPSLNSHGSFSPSRAGAPFHSYSSSVPSSTTNSATRTKRANPDEPPADLLEHLRPVLDQVHAMLVALQVERGGNVPTLRGTGLSIVRHPERDHLAIARDLERWALVGAGCERDITDWPRQYATFLSKAPKGSACRPSSTGGNVITGKFDHFDKAAGLC